MVSQLGQIWLQSSIDVQETVSRVVQVCVGVVNSQTICFVLFCFVLFCFVLFTQFFNSLPKIVLDEKDAKSKEKKLRSKGVMDIGDIFSAAGGEEGQREKGGRARE